MEIPNLESHKLDCSKVKVCSCYFQIVWKFEVGISKLEIPMLEMHKLESQNMEVQVSLLKLESPKLESYNLESVKL